ncbi:hypothetical protein VNO80_30455 [Phaseolus coccineus]|uniref:Uncharacterized protein n=1 Tax=Phaseolus coccineus TaxID=3886 RepID=A0AAN9QJI5_PHACN
MERLVVAAILESSRPEACPWEGQRRSLTGKRRMKDLLLQKDNCFCADCNAPDPKWAAAIFLDLQHVVISCEI